MVSRFSSLVETTPRLTLVALRRGGVFRTSAWIDVTLEGSEVIVRCQWSTQCEVTLEWEHGHQTVGLQWRKLRYGPAAYFDRPDDGGICTTLYLAGDRFLNREALGLTYSSQLMTTDERADLRLDRVVTKLQGAGPRQGARGAVKARLLDALRENQEKLSPEAWAHLDRDEAQRYARRRRRPLRSDPLMGVRWALFRGRTRKPYFPSSLLLWMLDQPPADTVVQIPLMDLAPLEAADARKADMPELDLRALRPRRGFPRGHKLVWGDGEERVTVYARIEGVVGHRRLQMLIHLHQGLSMEVARQEIILVGGRRPGDLFMQCPVTGRRILKAYLRRGRFASSQGQNLR